MRITTLSKAAFLTTTALFSAGCAHDESKVAQPGNVRVSNDVAVTTAGKGQVDTAGELRLQAEAQQSSPAETLPTPDRSQWRPRMPMVRAGSCPGEDCTYGYVVQACEDLPLVETDSSGAKPTGIIVHKGDSATLVTGNLHLLQPGIVVMKRDYTITDLVDESSDYKAPRPDTLRFFAGDTVYVLDYLELGAWNWWYRGKLASGDEFWTGVLQRSYGPGDDERPAVSISRPRGEWWYKLQVNANSEGGWVRAGRGWWVELKFVNGDWKCGGPPGDSDLSGTQ